MGKGCEDIYHTFLLFWHCGGGGVFCGIVPLIPIQGEACRGLIVREWNHGVGGGVGVVPVIDRYLGLGCFRTVGWLGQHCHCPRRIGGPCFHSLSSLQFLPRVLPGHWIGSIRLRIVYASYTFEGILGIFWRYYLPTPLLGQDMTQGQFLSGV